MAKEALISAAFLAGRKAGKESLSPLGCPYPDNSPEAIQWKQGWMFSNEEAARYADAMVKRDKERTQWERDLSTGARDDSPRLMRGRAA